MKSKILIPTKFLIPTQNGLRHSVDELSQMCDFVFNGGFFNEENLSQHDSFRKSLIAITQTEDGLFYIRDGLHRATIIHSLRGYLREDEFFVEKMDYKSFQEINLSNNWFTPFDLKTEVRLSDFHHFKTSVLSKVGEDAIKFIVENKDKYCCPRKEEHYSLDSYVKRYLL